MALTGLEDNITVIAQANSLVIAQAEADAISAVQLKDSLEVIKPAAS